MEQLQTSNLPPEKVREITIHKMNSLVSQINVYLTEEEVTKIREQGNKRAETDFQNHPSKEYSKSSWTKKEKWTILWATNYAGKKHKNASNRCKEWMKIFYHHCPGKQDVPRSRLTTQKSNILTYKIFSEHELNEMDRQVNRLLEDDVDPLEHPIPVPEQIQSDENARQEPGIQTSSQIEVDMENTPDSYHDTEEIDHDTQELREDAMDDDTENEMKVVEEELLNKIEEVKEMPMSERPRLIKLKETKLFQETLSQVNEALGKLTTEEMTLEELNIYTYGSALYIQEKIAPWTKSKALKKNIYMDIEMP